METRRTCPPGIGPWVMNRSGIGTRIREAYSHPPAIPKSIAAPLNREREIRGILSKEAVRQNAFRLPRVNFYLGNNRWPKVEHLERLFKTSCLKEWYGELHESPSIVGEIGDLKHPVFHYTHRDLSSMVKKTLVWSDVEARLRLEAGHPPMYWWRFPRVMMGTFFDWYIL